MNGNSFSGTIFFFLLEGEAVVAGAGYVTLLLDFEEEGCNDGEGGGERRVRNGWMCLCDPCSSDKPNHSPNLVNMSSRSAST